MDRKFAQLLVRNGRLKTGLTGVLVGTGTVAVSLWHLYTRTRSPTDQVTPDLGPEYISLPPKVLDSIAINYSNDDMKMDPAETKEDIKSMIPRHLRKPWRLLHQANHGDYEQHLRSVRDLSRSEIINIENSHYIIINYSVNICKDDSLIKAVSKMF